MPNISWERMRIYGVVCIIAIIYHWSYMDVGINLSDEGVLLEGVNLHRENRLDFNRFCHWSSLYAWFDALFRITGDSILVERTVWLIMRSLAATVVFAIAWNAVGYYAFIGYTLTLLGSGPWHKSFIPFFTILGLFILVQLLTKQTWRYVMLAGALFAVASGMHLFNGVINVFAFLLAVSLDFILFRKTGFKQQGFKSQLGLFLLTYLILLPICAPFVLSIDWSDWLQRHRQVVASDYLGFQEFFRSISMNWRLLYEAPRYLFQRSYLDLPILTIIISSLYLVFRRKHLLSTHQRIIFATCVVSLISYTKVLARFDLPHLFQNAPPTYILLSILIAQGGRILFTQQNSLKERLKPVCILSGFLAVYAAAMALDLVTTADYYTGGIGIGRISREMKLPFAHAPLYMPRHDGEQLLKAVQVIQKLSRPDDCLFAAPFIPMFYFLAQRRSATDVPLFDRPEDFYTVSEQEVIADIKRCHTPVVILKDELTDGLERNRFSRIAPKLYDFLMTDYESYWKSGDLEIRALRNRNQ